MAGVTMRIRQERTQEKLLALIQILYGLAIVSGAKTAADFYFQTVTWCPAQTWTYFLLAGSALSVGLSDWLVYHFVVSEHPYSDVWRVLSDMLFPIGIFSLFYAVRSPIVFLVLLAMYFIACWAYLRAIWTDLPEEDRRLLAPGVWGAMSIVVLGAALRSIFRYSGDLWAAMLAAIGCVPWIVVNLYYVRRQLLPEHPKSAAQTGTAEP